MNKGIEITMRYWIFVISVLETDDGFIDTNTIIENIKQTKFWGFWWHKKQIDRLRKGDKVIFYKGAPEKRFYLMAELDSNCFSLSPDQKVKYQQGDGTNDLEYGVFLTKIKVFNPAIRIRKLIPNLDFIVHKKHWGVYFKNLIKSISKNDFEKIISVNEPDNEANLVMLAEVNDKRKEISNLKEETGRICIKCGQPVKNGIKYCMKCNLRKIKNFYYSQYS